MRKIKIALLPLYIQLYTDISEENLKKAEQQRKQAAQRLAALGLDVFEVPVCHVKEEFAAAARSINEANVDAVVTLHLAYSPSLESIDALLSLNAPIVVLDTTPTADFGEKLDAGEIMANHGIHGVQDMCNLLLRHRRPFWIEAGHFDTGDVLERLMARLRAAAVAKALRTARVGIAFEAFSGMGDFLVSPEKLLSDLGVRVSQLDRAKAAEYLAEITDGEIDAEIAENAGLYDVKAEIDEDYRQSVRACLMTRKWLEREALTAFTVTFLDITKDSGVPRMPFLECSKAMGRGIGYAGEGDTLTAALVGALMSVYPETTFSEMFCPGWSDNTIFLSHMGEMNLGLSCDKPTLIKLPFKYADSGDTMVAYGRLKPGPAVFVNLAPSADGYSLVLAPIDMLDMGGSQSMKTTTEGWFRSKLPVEEFLAAYSRVGGTHHAAIVYGDALAELRTFGEMMGFDVKVIG